MTPIRAAALALTVALLLAPPVGAAERLSRGDRENRRDALALFDEGREIFRFDTFGDEAFWGDTSSA